MLDWLRRFLQSDDPIVIVKVADGLVDAEAQMARDALRDGGLPAYAKNMDPALVFEGRSLGFIFALFVKQSDLEGARDILEPLLTPAQLMRGEGEAADDAGLQPNG